MLVLQRLTDKYVLLHVRITHEFLGERPIYSAFQLFYIKKTKFDMLSFIAFSLILLAVYWSVKNSVAKSREKKRKKSEGEVLQNRYIMNHEKKLIDDAEYQEYLDWCKFKGESPADKQGFDEHRMKEYLLYKKLTKYGIDGLK